MPLSVLAASGNWSRLRVTGPDLAPGGIRTKMSVKWLSDQAAALPLCAEAA
jgi:hypothetical protein